MKPTRLVPVIAAIVLCASGGRAWAHQAEYCKGTSASAVKKFDGAALLLSTQEIQDAEAAHLPWGYPRREKKLLYHKEFVFQALRGSEWVKRGPQG
jgi:hypothetical protein